MSVRSVGLGVETGPVRSPVLDRSWAGLDLPVLISSWGIGLATVDRSELQGSIPYFRGEIADADQSGGADRSSGADRSNVTNQSCSGADPLKGEDRSEGADRSIGSIS